MGHKTDTVEYRIDNGEWSRMLYTETFDPTYYKTLLDWDASETVNTGRRPSNPVMSKHVWQAPIPFKLAAGTHTIEVRAKDRYGVVHTGKKTYTIVE